MPRLTSSNPKYRKHRASGQALVTLNGKDHYLGPHGTAASRNEYDRLIGEWLANGRRLKAGAADLAVVELIAAYWKHAKDYYRGSDPHSGVLASLRLALGHVKRLYGRTPAAEFGPLALKAVRESMVSAGWSRKYVNAQAGRVRRMFKWAVGCEMVPASVLQGLQAVEGLRHGRTDARESDPVTAVPDAHVDAVKSHVSRQVWAMIELQRLTGMRPGEVCAMRTGDVDTTGTLWTYRPQKHKTAHHGHARTVYLGPKAQAVLAPWLRPNLTEYLFQPREAEAERRERAHAARKTPGSCGNVPGSNRSRRPMRKPLERCGVTSYRRAIATACESAFGMPAELRDPRKPSERAKLTPEQLKARRAARASWRAEHVWSPHQLRHNAGTFLRKQFGLEAAQVILGHRNLSVTEIYAEKNVEAAMRIMAAVG